MRVLLKYYQLGFMSLFLGSAAVQAGQRGFDVNLSQGSFSNVRIGKGRHC